MRPALLALGRTRVLTLRANNRVHAPLDIKPRSRHRSKQTSSALNAQSMPESKATILWFRKGLRLHDNPALVAACDGATHMHPVFIIDPWFMSPEKINGIRIKFLLESLEDLDASLRKLDSRLHVLLGKPEEVLPKLFDQLDIKRLCYEYDTEPYAQARDGRIKELASKAGVEVLSPIGHTLFDTEWLIHKAGGKAPLTYQSFTKLVDKVGPPPDALPAPTNLPKPRGDTMELAAKAGICGDGSVPALSALGYTELAEGMGFPFKGGESQALIQMKLHLDRKAWVAKFEKPMTKPTDFNPAATTQLSPYLKFGCLSPRLFYSELLQIYRTTPGSSKPPVSLEGQMLWREFFYTCSVGTPNFDKMVGNPICKQIPWDDNLELLAAWEEGRTGYPWIDAAMTQLTTQGWLHHLARHAVACFLTRGDLFCHWERGRDVFDKYLVDSDWALNNANWMWLSASAFFAQYFRVYSPVAFGKKSDPEGKYIRHFLPVLKDMPAKYIYEPWTAPLEVQRKARCIVGKDYPKPIVDHATIHKENISRMAAAYNAAKASEGAASSKSSAGGGNIKSDKTANKRQKTLHEL